MVSVSAGFCLADVSARLNRSALQAAGWTGLTSQHFLGASLPESASMLGRKPNHEANDGTESTFSACRRPAWERKPTKNLATHI